VIHLRGSRPVHGQSSRFPAPGLIKANLNPKVIQARLGHATIAETMGTYGHLFPDQDDLGRGAIDALLLTKNSYEMIFCGGGRASPGSGSWGGDTSAYAHVPVT
jgi:hypothetical protein